MAKKTIMLVCSAGMSTSLLVTKMEAAAKEKGMEIDIFAVSSSEASARIDDKEHPIDVILLGPQVRFMKKQFEDKVAGTGIPVAVIEMREYGTMNGEAVLNTAISLAK